jgi:hypothetical protein
MTRHQPWTQQEILELRRLYPNQLTHQVAQALGRSASATHQKARLLGIVKTLAFAGSQISGRRATNSEVSPALRAAQFKRGMTPWNKGIEYNPGGRSADTRFQAGNMPHTWKPVGTYRVIVDTKTGASQLQQKTSERAGPSHVRWLSVARIVWEKNNGPIPAKNLIVFKLGMATLEADLITPDRLQCITRAENAKRNSMATRNPELAKLYQLKGAINRQVNRLTRASKTQAENNAP